MRIAAYNGVHITEDALAFAHDLWGEAAVLVPGPTLSMVTVTVIRSVIRGLLKTADLQSPRRATASFGRRCGCVDCVPYSVGQSLCGPKNRSIAG